MQRQATREPPAPGAAPDIFADLTAWLEQQKQAGVERIYLPPAVRAELFEDIAISPVIPQPAPSPERPPPSEPMPAARPPVQPAARPPSRPAAAPPPSAPPSATDRDWPALASAVAACTACDLHRTRDLPVFGEGSRQAELMMIGAAPGAGEDRDGRPFTDAAGELLGKMIGAMQFSRSEVYLTNVVKCRPAGGRRPTAAEAEACRNYAVNQIKLVRPKVIVLLGEVALHTLLGPRSLTRSRGHWHEFAGIPVMPTYHPAYLLQSPKAKREVWSDLQQAMRRLGRDPRETMRQTRMTKS